MVDIDEYHWKKFLHNYMTSLWLMYFKVWGRKSVWSFVLTHSPDYCSFILSWSQGVAVLQLCSSTSILRWLFWVFCLFIQTSESVDIHKITCWDFDWHCVEFIGHVGKYWHFDSIESSYLWTWNTSLIVFLWFLSPEFCSFPHTDLVYILLHLYQIISFWGGDDVNGIVFLVSNFTVWLLVYGKVVDFCILTLSPETLLSLFINCRIFFCQFFLIFYIWDYAICEQREFCFFLPNLYTFYSFFVIMH